MGHWRLPRRTGIPLGAIIGLAAIFGCGSTNDVSAPPQEDAGPPTDPGRTEGGPPSTPGPGAADAAADAPRIDPNDHSVIAMSAGGFHTCVLFGNHTIKCWGLNTYGALGLGDGNARGDNPGEMGANLPTVDLGPGRTAKAVAAGSEHTCAILDDDTLRCWGANTSAQLGLGDHAMRGLHPGEMGASLPAVDFGPGRKVKSVSAGLEHTCAILDDDTVRCWGGAFNGALGLGDFKTRGGAPGEMGASLPAVDLGPGRTAKGISAGQSRTCALLDNASVKCWGKNEYGGLGLGDTADRGKAAGEMGAALPALDFGPGRTAKAVSAEGCALLDDDSIKCWGYNGFGRLGLGDTSSRGDAPGEMGQSLPVVDLGPGRKAAGLATDGQSTCALLDNATVKCWGVHTNGQLGLGTNFNSMGDNPGEMGAALPAVDVGPGRTVKLLSARGSHVCVVLDDGTVKCWGANLWGQLGLGDVRERGHEAADMGAGLPVVPLW